MRDKWHIVALAVTASICTKVFATYAFSIGYFIWMFLLFFKQRITQTHFALATAFFSLTLFLVPQINNGTEVDQQFHQTQVVGEITQALNKKERVIESVMREEQSNKQLLLLYFPEAKEDRDEINLPHGASCTIAGDVERAASARNPGQFDYNQYLQSQGISHQLIIESPADISCTGHSFLHNIHLIRYKLISFIEERMDPEVGGWLRALVLGDTSGIDQDVIELFQRWGLSHILAISGLHVGLIVGLLYALLVKTGMLTKETASYILMGFIPFYIIIAGAQPSVLRAGLTVFLFLILQAWFQRISTTDGLSLIFIFLICMDPYIVYHIGFQFSFITTFTLLLSRKWLSQNSSMGWNIAHISFIAQMAILPIQINAFFVFQPLSIILNIIIVTYFSVAIIPFLFLYGMLYPLWGPLATIIETLFIRIHTIVLQFIGYIDVVGFPPMVIGSFPFFASVLYYVLLVAMMIAVQEKKLRHSFLAGTLLVTVIAAIQMGPYVSSEGRVTVLDIGQGDAIVVELPYRKGVFMIDAGATFSFQEEKVSHTNFKRVIQPYLYFRGIDKVDALIISHEHLDHTGSVSLIMDTFNVDHYIISMYYELNEVEEHMIKEQQVHVHRVQAGDHFEMFDQTFFVASPEVDFNDSNANSLTVITELGGKNWIFTGDIYKEQEEMILTHYPHIPIDIWKVAHHGSSTSSSEKAITHYQPEVFLIPVGENNRFGHPTSEVLEVVERAQGTIYRTDQHGAIQYRFKDASGTFMRFLHTLWVNTPLYLK